MLKCIKFLIVAIIFFLTLGKPSSINAINYNLTGKWNWTDTTNGQNYFGTAQINQNGTTLTLTWQWKDQNNSQWFGTGFTSNAVFSLDGSYNNGQLTAHWDGEVLDSGNKLQGTWTQSDRQHGTFVAVRLIEFEPLLTWQRSTEAQDKIVTETSIGSEVNEALQLPLDLNQTVFDNGVSTPTVNKNAVASGIFWASWPQYSSPNATSCGPIFELRHFQAKFNLPSGFDPTNVEKVKLKSPDYSGDTFPINDNAYIYINGNFVKRLGTSYGASNIGMNGRAPYANETDGWIANGNLGQAPASFLHPGQNTLDIVAGETCRWGGMGKLELVLEGQFPSVPYFNQTDPPWGSQEYDHANSLDLNCGTTMAQCGCAVTSAAMILKYYGVDKSPDGPSTTPESLNNWLKTNKGYVNGDLNWLAIASYSKKTHDKFGTQIIDYLGRVKSANFTLLNEDLSQNRPVILQEPGHFIMATGIQGSTYSINDPRWTSKTTLQAYGNTFQEMRRYAKANTDLSGLLISTTSFTEFLVIDSQGRKTGKDLVTGQIYEEIPNSSYYLQTPLTNDTFENPLPPPENSGNFFFEALDPEAGNYFILVHSPNRNSTVTFLGYDQNAEVSEQIRTISELTEYVLNYSSEPGTQIQVAEIDVDIKPDSDPNSINLKNNGVIPVAILSTPSFDATQVNVSTIKFGPNQATEIHNKGHLEDMDNDGDVDLMLHFETQDTGIQNTDSQACLTGATLNGITIQGCDSIRIVTE